MSDAPPDSPPRISVIVALDPFNPFLPEGGRPYLAQTAAPEAFELIVVDWLEGPSQAEAIDRLRADAPAGLRIAYMRHPSYHRAALNNMGVRHARAPIVCFAADDAAVGPTFVAAHLAFHQAHPEPHRAAFGAFRSPDAQRAASPLLRWLEDAGELSGFRLRDPHDRHPAAFFNAANTSVKKAFLLAAGPFDERLPFPAQDDAEMARRLGRLGLSATFIDGAAVTHDHLLFLPERADQVARGGYCQALLDADRAPAWLRPALPAWAAARALARFARYVARNGPGPQGLRWKWHTTMAYLRGYHQHGRRPGSLSPLDRGLVREGPAGPTGG